MTTSLKGVLYQSGNLDFPRSQNEWAFARMQNLRSDQQKRIVMNPEVAPIELTRSDEVDPAESPWLDGISELINASDNVNLQLRSSTLRLRKAVCDVAENLKLVILVSQEAIDEFANAHWQRIAYFYAYRHDGFRFDLKTMISMKDNETERSNIMELVPRAVAVEDECVPTITFDATGSTANVNIVEWRGDVKEGASGLFKKDDLAVQFQIPQARQPLVFLYENRTEFKNHSYVFSGEKLTKALKRVLKRAKRRSDTN